MNSKSICELDRGTCSEQFGMKNGYTGCSSKLDCEFKNNSLIFLNRLDEQLKKTRKRLELVSLDEKFDQDDILELTNEVDHLRDTLKEVLQKQK